MKFEVEIKEREEKREKSYPLIPNYQEFFRKHTDEKYPWYGVKLNQSPHLHPRNKYCKGGAPPNFLLSFKRTKQGSFRVIKLQPLCSQMYIMEMEILLRPSCRRRGARRRGYTLHRKRRSTGETSVAALIRRVARNSRLKMHAPSNSLVTNAISKGFYHCLLDRTTN